MRMFSILMAICAIVLIAASLPAAEAPAASADPTATTPAEAELGKKTAEQIEKSFKLVTDEAEVAHLNAIVAKIVPFTQRPDVVYTCKILDVGALNAMAIPGGTIYVTKGLLKAVESDHELAGVLAHEIAHNACFHARKMMKREAGSSAVQIAAVIASVYMNRSDEVSAGQIITMSSLVKQSLLNGYSVELEREADLQAVEYLSKTKEYDPLGLYSVILGFLQMESHRPQVELGVLKTHPYSEERKLTLEHKLDELGITRNIWRVVNFRAEMVPPKEGEQGYAVKLGEATLITFTTADGDRNAETRAKDAVTAINRRLQRSYVQPYDVTLDQYNGNAYIRMSNVPVITLTPADADAAKLTLPRLGIVTVQNAKDAIWREMVKRG